MATKVFPDDYTPHRWESHSLRNDGKMFRCAGPCKGFQFIFTGDQGPCGGWCEIPGLGSRWKVGDVVGFVTMLNFSASKWIFRLQTDTGESHVFKIGEGWIA
jgi:hypothetical protein